MAFSNIVIITLLNVWCFSYSSGSRIQFVAEPTHVTPSLSPTLTLTCALNDTDPSSSSGLVGRRDLHSVTHTDINMQYVTVVSVLHNGIRVASVTEHMQAKVLTNWTNVAVTGHVDAASSVKGFLTVNIVTPHVHQTGDFSCEIHSLHPVDFQDVKFSQSVTVTPVPPTMAQWMDHVHNPAATDNNTDELAVLKQSLMDKEAELNARHLTVQHKNMNLMTLDRQLDILLSNITDLNAVTSSIVPHVEFGSLGTLPFYCYFPYFVQFSRPYFRPPHVVQLFANETSIIIEEARTTGFTLRPFLQNSSSIDEKGFVFNCNTRGIPKIDFSINNIFNDFNTINCTTDCVLLWLSFNWHIPSDDPIATGFIDGNFDCTNKTSFPISFNTVYKAPPTVYFIMIDRMPSDNAIMNGTNIGHQARFVEVERNGVARVDEQGIIFSCSALINTGQDPVYNSVFRESLPWIVFPNH